MKDNINKLKRLDKPSIKTIAIAVLAVVLLAMVVTKVYAASSDLSRIETPEEPKTVNVSAQETKPAEKAPEKPAEKPAEPKQEEAPAPVDPNGCEAKGMWWRADNFECIEKPAIKESKPESPAATSVTTQSSAPTARASGDCSLVNGYNWPTQVAYRVCMQESSGNPHNANWSDDHTSWAGCMGSFGLFQINCSHGQVFDGPRNVAIAYQMWSAAGGTFWQDWPNTCRKVGC